MKLLISTDVSAFREAAGERSFVRFCDPGPALCMPLTDPETITVWICHGREVTSDHMSLWLGQACQVPKMMLVKDVATIPRLQEYAKGRLANLAAIPPRLHPDLPWAESILRTAEMLYAQARADNELRSKDAIKSSDGKATVLLVGAGIVNLVTAELLATRGYQVRITDAGPDPRSCKDWRRLGVTSGGGNARMYTCTEADNYNEKGGEIYRNMRSIFRRTARNGGWSVKAPKDFSAAELAWVDAFEHIPPWLARAYREDIHKVNQEAGELWRERIKATPELFEGVEFREDILRLYGEPHALEAARQLNRERGTMIYDTSADEFIGANPWFARVLGSEHLAGGFTIDGFTVNIHPFVAKLLDRISGLGGELTWDCQVSDIRRNGSGEVVMLESQLGPLEADHFVISPGVTGNTLLRGTASENLIQGVLGVWMQVPNLDGLIQNSIKIHRRDHLVEDINVTVAKDAETGEDILQLGGGYGYVGLDRPSPDNPELAALFDEMEEVAHIYFPLGYAAAKERGTLWPGGNRRFCVRPFTPTGLGVFEKIPTASGGTLVITGGNNTGGFAQAPAIARAVQRALVGERDLIHAVFHPDRGRLPADVAYVSRFSESSKTEILETQALRLLLCCSDGPQHNYLRYKLEKAFPGFRCVIETSEGQRRHLWAKHRWIDAAYMEYHALRRYLSGYDSQRKAYFERLLPPNYVPASPDLVVDTLNCPQVWEAVEQWQPELTIVSGTKYIGRKLNERAGLMINLHIGHLPEYKGNHCIFFALYDEAVDRIAATLHQLTPQLDGGHVPGHRLSASTAVRQRGDAVHQVHPHGN